MNLAKRTYTLPPELVSEFESAVPGGKRSGVVADLLRTWLEHRRLEQLRRDIVEGCADMASTYLELESDFHPLEEEVARALDSSPRPRSRRESPARPGGKLGAG